MRPLRNHRITIRLSDDEHRRCLRAASELGMDKSEYLRHVLVSGSHAQVTDRLDQLRLALMDVSEPATNTAQEVMLLEVLLLMRRLSPPNDLRVVQGDLHRLGYVPWSMSRHPPS